MDFEDAYSRARYIYDSLALLLQSGRLTLEQMNKEDGELFCRFQDALLNLESSADDEDNPHPVAVEEFYSAYKSCYSRMETLFHEKSRINTQYDFSIN